MPPSLGRLVDESAALDDLRYQIRAKSVPEVAKIRRLKKDQIGVFAGLQASLAVRQAQGGGAVDGGRSNRLGRRQAQAAAGQGDRKLHALAPSRARIQVGGQRQQASRL